MEYSTKKTSSFLEGIDNEMLAGFIAETLERLDGAEQLLLAIETDPETDDTINALFRVLHTIKGDAQVLAYEDMSDLADAAENILSLARNGEIILSGSPLNIIFDSISLLRRLTTSLKTAISEDKNLHSDPRVSALVSRIGKIALKKPRRKLGEILVESGHISNDVLAQALKQQQYESLEVETADQPYEADMFPEYEEGETAKLGKMIRIDSARLDHLLDAIGELRIVSSILYNDRKTMLTSSNETKNSISILEKITQNIMEVGGALRMTPIKSIFDKMFLLVHGLVKNIGKEIEFSVVGGDTELDRTLVEKIGDPLVHLLRNAIDHGIEKPSLRKTLSKNRKGMIQLKAFHEGGNVFIEVKDDGCGLDRDIILTKAIESGMVHPGEDLSDADIFNIIFNPGFSTVESVSVVSGRGVGMDIVKQKIMELQGDVEISTEKGVGTKISIRLPLTLAYIDGLIVRVGDERYIISSSLVVEVIRLNSDEQFLHSEDRSALNFRGSLIPLLNISNIFGIREDASKTTEYFAVVVECTGKVTALRVNAILGREQFVFKKLARILSKMQYISGTVIMADGCISFVLDIDRIIKGN
ncbi:chemotaxis protein CheA [Desulfobacterales bacterium HSG16]|nr:chemotaxis protein CheA [Desulfobacterales bacterium HSG16]